MSLVPHPLLGSLLPVSAGAQVAVHEVSGEHVTTEAQGPEAHVCIVVPEGVHGSLLLTVGAQVVSFDCEVVLAPHSRLTLICVNTSSTTPSIRQRTRIGEHAHLHLLNVTLGAAVRHSLESTVVGERGVSSVDWVAYAKGAERQELSVRNIFAAAHGGGEVTMRAVAQDTATVDVRGMIDIGERGGGTHTYLTQQVLMLDPTAKVDASPALEIKTNDVKASHSASVMRVTPEDLYYFAARGIDPVQARGLLVRGFLGELAHCIDHAAAVETMTAAIEEKYAGVLV